jgi:transposase-like protein
MTTLSLMDRLPDEAAAWEYMEELRWGGKPVCPHCGNDDRCYFIQPRNGHRATSTGRVSHRRLWKCASCRKPFSVLNDTIMHGSKIPLRTWIMVIFEMASNKNGTAAYEVSRKYGVKNKTAWFMLHRIREAMKANPTDVLGGDGHVIVADETFIGGKVKNQHRQGRPRRLPDGGRGIAGSATRTSGQKVAVLTLIDRQAGEARSRVVADVTGATLAKAISEQVNMAGSTLHTDSAPAYRQLGAQFAEHQWVDHSRYEYVRGNVTSNQAENFFSQLKRSIDGTQHHVSRKHLPRYLAEFDFRYTTKTVSDTDRMLRVVEQVAGRRLAYRPLAAREKR